MSHVHAAGMVRCTRVYIGLRKSRSAADVRAEKKNIWIRSFSRAIRIPDYADRWSSFTDEITFQNCNAIRYSRSGSDLKKVKDVGNFV